MNLLTESQRALVTELRRMYGVPSNAYGLTGKDAAAITDRLDVVIALLWDINQKLEGATKR